MPAGGRGRVVLIEPVSSGWGLIRAGHDLGFEVIVVTAASGERIVPGEHLRHASDVLVVDTNSDEEVIRQVSRVHARDPLLGVIPGFEYYVPLAARLASNLGLASIPPETACDLHFKHRMRNALQRRAVPQPCFQLVQAEEDVGPALARTGLPCVVKPVGLAGSVLVRKASTYAEALQAYREIRWRRSADLERPVADEALIEEYVEGREYSVEGFVEKRQARVICITSKLLGPEPHFVEAGHVLPADVSDQDRERIAAYVDHVISALGLDRGPFHAELRCTARGPMLMEVAARLAGDHIPDLIRMALDIDFYRIAFLSHLGLPLGEVRGAAGGRWAGIRYLLDAEARSFADRGRYMMATGSSYAETLCRLERFATPVPS